MSRAHLAAAVFGVLLAPFGAYGQEVWSFNGPQGGLGTSAAFASVPSGLITTAMGFTNAGSAVNLFQKNAGGTEVGLGLTNDASGLNEITDGSFVQLSLNALSASQRVTVSLGTNSSSIDQAGAPEVWGLALSNTSGALGTVTQTGTGNGVTNIDATGFSFLDVTDTTAGPGNGILVSELDAPIGITPVLAPEPASAAVFCAGLLGLIAFRRRRED